MCDGFQLGDRAHFLAAGYRLALIHLLQLELDVFAQSPAQPGHDHQYKHTPGNPGAQHQQSDAHKTFPQTGAGVLVSRFYFDRTNLIPAITDMGRGHGYINRQRVGEPRGRRSADLCFLLSTTLHQDRIGGVNKRIRSNCPVSYKAAIKSSCVTGSWLLGWDKVKASEVAADSP